jgi:hypothetical protein
MNHLLFVNYYIRLRYPAIANKPVAYPKGSLFAIRNSHIYRTSGSNSFRVAFVKDQAFFCSRRDSKFPTMSELVAALITKAKGLSKIFVVRYCGLLRQYFCHGTPAAAVNIICAVCLVYHPPW